MNPDWHENHTLYSVEQMLHAEEALNDGSERSRTERNALLESFACNLASLIGYCDDSGMEIKPALAEARRRFHQDMATLSVFRGSWMENWDTKGLIRAIHSDVLFLCRKEVSAKRMYQKTCDRIIQAFYPISGADA